MTENKDRETWHAMLETADRELLEILAKRNHLIQSLATLEHDNLTTLCDQAHDTAWLTQTATLGQAQGLDAFFVTRVFRELRDHARRQQMAMLATTQTANTAMATPMTVAYQGDIGSYSHMVATRHFGAYPRPARYLGFDAFRSMLDAVAQDQADFGVLPIENTTAGSINESYDLLAEMNLSLVGEEIQEVNHCLIAINTIPLDQIRRVYSHPQALLQCSQFLNTLHHCRAEAYTDTAAAVAKIKAEGKHDHAAIASVEAAHLHGMAILKRNLANQKSNLTRMVIVAKHPAAVDLRIPCKTSVLFATKHKEGALLSCLNVCAKHHLNLTKLESRPRPNVPWQYLFYVDFEGNIADAKVITALDALAAEASFLKVFGSYPARTTHEATTGVALPQLPQLAWKPPNSGLGEDDDNSKNAL